jgi:hypothetical protein
MLGATVVLIGTAVVLVGGTAVLPYRAAAR